LLFVRLKYACTFLCVLLCLVCSFNGSSQCILNAGNNTSICPGESATLGGSPTVTGNSGAVTYNWTNGAASVANPTVSPASNTTYTLTVAGGGCQPGLNDQVTVTILSAPVASFSFAPNSTPCANTPIQFTYTGGACSGCSFLWNFGDGNTSTQMNPSHAFSSATGNGTQNFTVTLTVTGANDCETTQTSTVTVRRIPDAVLLDPFFEVESFLLCDGTTTQGITVSDGSTGTVTNYTINWGDATPNYNSATPLTIIPPHRLRTLHTPMGLGSLI